MKGDKREGRGGGKRQIGTDRDRYGDSGDRRTGRNIGGEKKGKDSFVLKGAHSEKERDPSYPGKKVMKAKIKDDDDSK